MITNPAEGVATSISTRVRDIAGLLSKAAKNYQVYLPNNRMFLASLEDARKALGEFLDVHEVLTLVVKEFELLYEGVSVYSNPDKHGSIAFRMYRDGVRLISFHRGITNAEMVAFFEALTKCMESESLEDDFVTLLWEKDLQSITYYEVNEFEGERDRKPAPSLSDSRTSFVRPDLAEMHWAEVARDADKFRPALDLTAVDLKEAQDLSFVVEDDLFLKRTWHVICSTLDLGNDKDSYLDLESAVIGFLDACLETRQIGFAADALAEVRARYGGRADEDTGAALARIVASRHTDRNMEAV